MNETPYMELRIEHGEVSTQEFCGCVLRVDRKTQVANPQKLERVVAFVPCDEHARALGMEGDDMEVEEVVAPEEMREVELPDPDGPEGYGASASGDEPKGYV